MEDGRLVVPILDGKTQYMIELVGSSGQRSEWMTLTFPADPKPIGGLSTVESVVSMICSYHPDRTIQPVALYQVTEPVYLVPMLGEDSPISFGGRLRFICWIDRTGRPITEIGQN